MTISYSVPAASTDVCRGRGSLVESTDPSGRPASRLTDGDTNTTNYTSFVVPAPVIDLGAIYALDRIKVWHYYSDGRTYHKTKTEVSMDGVRWQTIFDSAVDGEYAENSSGKTHDFDPTLVRYIRDSMDGSTANSGSHWVEIQAYNVSQGDPGLPTDIESYADVVMRDAPTRFWPMNQRTDYSGSLDHLPEPDGVFGAGAGARVGSLIIETCEPQRFEKNFTGYDLDFTGSLAAEAWIALHAAFAGREMTVFETDNHRLYFDGTGALTVDGTTVSATVTLADIGTTVGNHILWQVEGGNTVVYLDGALVADLTVTGDILSAETTLSVGKRTYQSSMLMSLLAFYGAPLATQSIADRQVYSLTLFDSMVSDSDLDFEIVSHDRKDFLPLPDGHLILAEATNNDYVPEKDHNVNPSHANFGSATDVGLYWFGHRDGSQIGSGVLPPHDVDHFHTDWVLALDASNGNWTPDYCDVDIEFLNEAGETVMAMRVRTDGSYRNGLWYGENLGSLTKTGQRGSYPRTHGHIHFEETGVRWVTRLTNNDNRDFLFACDVGSIVGMRFSNVQVQSSYGSSGNAYVFLRIDDGGYAGSGGFVDSTDPSVDTDIQTDYEADVLASSPNAYWTLGDLGDLGADASGNGHNGTVASGNFTHEAVGRGGKGLNLVRPSNSPLITIPDHADFKGSDLTLEFLCLNDENANLVVMERGGDNKSWSLQTGDDGFGTIGCFQFGVGSSGVTENSRVDNVPTLILSHVVVSNVGGRFKAWVNGKLKVDNTSGFDGSQNQGDIPLHLFSRNGSYNTNIAIGHIALYNRELTQFEIDEHFKSFIDSSGTAFFEGDFTAVPKESFDAAYDVDLNGTGTYDVTASGFENTGAVDVYLPGFGAYTGQTVVAMRNHDNVHPDTDSNTYSVNAEGTEFTAVEGGVTTTVPLVGVIFPISLKSFKPGIVHFYDKLGQVVYESSDLSLYGAVTFQVKVEPGQVLTHMDTGIGGNTPSISSEVEPEFKVIDAWLQPVWSNFYTREYVNWNGYDVQQGLEGRFREQPVLLARGDRKGLLRPDGQRVYEFGFIENRVTINGIPAADRRVLCYQQDGMLIDETRTDNQGNYRFDWLYADRRYMLVAQDKPEYGEAEYNAVAADYQLPTPYF